MRLKFGVAVATIVATFASLAFTALPAAAVNYATVSSSDSMATRTDISGDSQLGAPAYGTTQPYWATNVHGGIFEYGTNPLNAMQMVIRSFSNGALDTSFNSTGSVTVTLQIPASDRMSVDLTTYANGTKWMLLEKNGYTNSGLNYIHYGSYATGYTGTLTLPVGSTYYGTYCTSRPSGSNFTRLGGDITLLKDSGFSSPTVVLGCGAIDTNISGASTQYYNYLANLSGGTTLGTSGTWNVFSGQMTPSTDATNKSFVLMGNSVNPNASLTTDIAVTSVYLRLSTATQPTWYESSDTNAWTDMVILRTTVGGTTTSSGSVTYSPALVGSRNGTIAVPPRNNGTVYAYQHVTDFTTQAGKIFKLGTAGGSGLTSTTSTTGTGPLLSIALGSDQTPGTTMKVYIPGGGDKKYWEVNATTGAITVGGTFSGSMVSYESFFWAPATDSGGISFYARTGSATLTRMALTTTPPTPTAPATPAAPTATVGAGQASLSWSAPNANYSPITDYEIDYSSDSGSTWTTFADGTSTSTSATVTGLVNGTGYVFRVRAVNAIGTSSSSSSSNSITPIDAPTAPTGVAGSYGNSQVALSWTAPSTTNGSAITDYTVQYSSNSGSTWTTFSHTASTSTAATITGLTNGTAYLFKVAAVNGVGAGAYSVVSAAVTPATLPATMSAPSVTAGDTQVTLGWASPATNGCSITDYAIQVSNDGGTTWAAFSHNATTSTTIVVTGLTNNIAYRFQIAATNCAGTAVFSAASASSTPNPVPSQTSGLAVATNGLSNQLVLSWTAPSGNGSAISDYLIEFSTNGGTSWNAWSHSASTATTATITGLTNGASYSFRVSAINAIGTGTASAVSTAVTALALPSALTSAPSATASPGQIILTWSAPANNGGSSITDYLIEYSSNGGSTWSTYLHTASPATSITLIGLTASTSYVFRVSAVNALGNSTASSTSTTVIAQAATAPSAVGQPTVTLGTNPGEVVLSWSAPVANGSAITDYLIEYSTDGTTWVNFADGISSATSATVTGLTLGTAYSFRIKAVNGIGTAAASASSNSTPVLAVPSAIASAPLAVSTPGQVVLTWSAPSSNGGSAVTDYLIQYSSDGGATWSTWSHTASTATTATITGLTSSGDYSFKVSAVNNVGTSTASTNSQIVTALAPTAPGSVSQPTATPGSNPGEVVLSWTAPSANGSAITDYVVQYSPDGGVTWITFNDGTSASTSATITGLTLGTSYTFRVQAVNSIGSGSVSNSSVLLPVITVPGTFSSGVNAIASPGSVALTWSAPPSNGGSSITDYLIEYSSNGGISWSPYAHSASPTTSALVSGLTAGSTYTFRVSAINAAGTGPVSTVAIPVVALAATQPDSVSQLAATAGANPGEVVLTWVAPAANGSAITDYLIEYSPDGGTTWLTFSDGTSTATTVTVTGLTVGTAYVFRVTAVNSVGVANVGSASTPQAPASQIQSAPQPAAPLINPRHVPGKITFAFQASNTIAGSPLAIEGANLDMILVVLVGNRQAQVISQTETKIEVAPAKTVFGYADITLVYALGTISFPRAVNIVEPGPTKISLNSFFKQKVSERSAKALLSAWPATSGATEVMCVAKYTKKSNRALAMWRAKRVCSMLQVNRPDLVYKVAVARKYVKAQLELRIKY